MKHIRLAFLLIGIVLPHSVVGQAEYVVAEQEDSALSNHQKLLGSWQKKGTSTVLEIREAQGKLEGIITRADWEPGLVGKLYLRDLQSDKKSNRWVGEGYSKRKDNYRQVFVDSAKENVLKIRLKRSKTDKWLRVDSIE